MNLIQDAHTHFFSRVFFDTLAKLAPGDQSAEERLSDLSARAGIEIPGPDAAELQLRWIEQMDGADVAAMVTFASVPEEAEVVAEAARTSGGRLIGYTVANLAAASAPAFIDRALGELGLRGVVLFPALHHYALGDEACRPALVRIAAHRGVCVVHCGVLKVKARDLLGLPRTHDARFASPLSLVRAACEHPDIPFVIPHFGGGMFSETLLAGSWCENVYVDTSSSNEWMRALWPHPTLRDIFRRTIDVFGPERILFGTDSSTFPRGYRRDLLETQIAAMDEVGVDDAARAQILGGNLARLLG